MISVSTDLCSSAMPDFGQPHAPAALEMERLGDDADRQNSHLAGDPSDHGRSAGAGAPAHAGGHENHMRARQMVANLLDRLLGRRPADFGFRAGAEALGDLQSHLDDPLGARRAQRLRVGVGDDEVDPYEAGDDHVVDGVAAGAAHSAHHDPRLQLPQFGSLDIDRHS